MTSNKLGYLNSKLMLRWDSPFHGLVSSSENKMMGVASTPPPPLARVMFTTVFALHWSPVMLYRHTWISLLLGTRLFSFLKNLCRRFIKGRGAKLQINSIGEWDEIKIALPTICCVWRPMFTYICICKWSQLTRHCIGWNPATFHWLGAASEALLSNSRMADRSETNNAAFESSRWGTLKAFPEFSKWLHVSRQL